MGGRFGRKKKDQYDPSFAPYGPYSQGMPPGGYLGPRGYSMPPGGYPGQPPYPYGGPGYDPGGFGGEEPYDVYGYGGGGGGYGGYDPTLSFETYGGGMRRGPYGGGGGMSPWNYGNFYMGNTTMQMMPYMQRKVAKYAAKQGMGMGMGGFGGFMPMMPMMPALPMMPMTPCLPASCSMPMASPMMAAATPLPIAFNPLVQGMYPMAGMNSFNWMTPSNFMSALSSGPMAYRPPASIEFPSNINMVMPYPFGAPNPLLSPSFFGGFTPQYNFGGGISCCCTYCAPPPVVAPPAITYYPRPVSVPQPCPVACPVPVPIPNIQQVPVPRPVTVVAPPIIAGCNSGFGIPAGAPLMPSQGGFTQGGFGQTLVMGSDENSTTQTLLNDETPEKPKHKPSVRKPIDQARREKAQKLAASLSNLGLNTHFPSETTSSKTKHRTKTRLNSNYTSELDFTTLDRISSRKRHGKKSSHHHHRNSDHDCVVCQQKQLDKYT